MASECHHLLLGAAALSHQCSRSSPQAMDRDSFQALLVAPTAEPIAETSLGERLAEGCLKERHVAGGRGIDYFAQLGQDREPQLCRAPVPVFVLHEFQAFAAVMEFNMLLPKPDRVALSLPGAQSQCQCQAGRRLDRMGGLELLDILQGPCGVAFPGPSQGFDERCGRAQNSKIRNATCFMRDGHVLADCSMQQAFERLKKRRFIHSTNGKPYRITQAGLRSVRSQPGNR